MRIAMIGSGYVGLVSGACFAELGHEVVCVDCDDRRTAKLQRGEMPIYEPGLDTLVAKGQETGQLRFETKLAPAVAWADAVFIAVGTPSRRGDGHADLTYVHDAAREIARAADGFTVVVTKSTVPVGTGDMIAGIIATEYPGADIALVSNPEFLREGSAITDFMQPDRIVIGSDDCRAAAVIEEIYRPLVMRSAPVLVTQRRTAELIKYASNAFLATKITFINEMADLCEAVDADVSDVARGMGFDSRIGAQFLRAGPGYGGSCFPKDTLALLRTAQDHGLSLRVVEGAVTVNDMRKAAMARKVKQACGGSLRGKTVAVLGLTFKPDTDDMRDSPAIAIIEALQRLGARVRAHDPVGMEQAKLALTNVEFADSPYACAEEADVLALATEWIIYQTLDFDRIKKVLRAPIIVDFRNALCLESMAQHGFDYTRVGAKGHRLDRPGSEPQGTPMLEANASRSLLPEAVM
jgi:UDPglucose 6-dehydrogenase